MELMVVAKEIQMSLTKEEVSVISHSIEMGFTNGSVGNVEWELEHQPEDSTMLIAMKFKLSNGIISDPNWKISYKRYKGLEF